MKYWSWPLCEPHWQCSHSNCVSHVDCKILDDLNSFNVFLFQTHVANNTSRRCDSKECRSFPGNRLARLILQWCVLYRKSESSFKSDIKKFILIKPQSLISITRVWINNGWMLALTQQPAWAKVCERFSRGSRYHASLTSMRPAARIR